ncbi:MAG: VOC family protein [Nitrososphaerota archaeon]|nr:VOC family protein [Nitrososphaerota archaeon]MDG7024942.1 VOC family protein [Nitrososphaerota archaeon]
MTIDGIDTVTIVVADKKKALRWYVDVLGLKVAYIGPPVSDPDPGVQGTVDNPGHWIELGPGRPRTRVHLCEPGSTGITFLTPDINSEYERLRRKGVKFLTPPKRMDWGEWICEFADPDGNEFDSKQPSGALSRPSETQRNPVRDETLYLTVHILRIGYHD